MQEYSGTYGRKFGQSIIYGALVGVFCTLVFAAGFVFRGFVDVQIADASAFEVDFSLLSEVQHLLDRHYLRQQPTLREREYAAIKGMLAALNDRYTFFVDPPVAQSESDVLAGTYGGVGLQIKRNERGDLVIYPFADSPAAQAGIKEGDILIAINGASVDPSTQADVVDQMLRGEVKEGNGVEITTTRSQDGVESNYFVPFAVINVPSVVWRNLEESPSIGYIQILIFTSRTPDELKNALDELKDARMLILDLRNNSGGLLQESIAVASQFLDGGVIVYERDNQSEEILSAIPGGLATQVPVVVLVNQNTASAAELVAGALRDRDRAILMGQMTYGKGTVQQIFRLSDNSSLHITAAEWLTPRRQHLDGAGLEPDIIITSDPNGRDLELGEAIRYLEAEYPQN